MSSGALGGRGYQGFCDNLTKALVLPSVTIRRWGVKYDLILHDHNYGRPPTQNTNLSSFD
jgi:hypothetical protein